MSKLLLVTDAHTADQLLMLVPDTYREEDVLETVGKQDMRFAEIAEMDIDPVVEGELSDLGIRPWREYWG